MVMILLKPEKIILKGQKTKSDGFMYSVLAILGVLFLACIATLVAWTFINKRGFPIPADAHTQNSKLKYLEANRNRNYELKCKLRLKKDLNSTCASEQVAQLFYDLIQDLLQKGDIITQSFLLSLVEYLGIIYINNTELDVSLTESNKSQILEQISILISELYSIKIWLKNWLKGKWTKLTPMNSFKY